MSYNFLSILVHNRPTLTQPVWAEIEKLSQSRMVIKPKRAEYIQSMSMNMYNATCELWNSSTHGFNNVSREAPQRICSTLTLVSISFKTVFHHPTCSYWEIYKQGVLHKITRCLFFIMPTDYVANQDERLQTWNQNAVISVCYS